LEDWFIKLMLSTVNFIIGLKYVAAERKKTYLINFIVGEAKLVVAETKR